MKEEEEEKRKGTRGKHTCIYIDIDQQESQLEVGREKSVGFLFAKVSKQNTRLNIITYIVLIYTYSFMKTEVVRKERRKSRRTNANQEISIDSILL